MLLDYVAYANQRSIAYSPLEPHGIPLRVLKQMAADRRIDSCRGDILFIHTGLTKLSDSQMTPADKLAYGRDPDPHYAGVEWTEMFRWLWDQGFNCLAIF